MNRKSVDKTILQVNMLGGFSLVYGKKPLPNNYSGTSKMMQLFQILLYAGREGIPRAELIERLDVYKRQGSWCVDSFLSFFCEFCYFSDPS